MKLALIGTALSHLVCASGTDLFLGKIRFSDAPTFCIDKDGHSPAVVVCTDVKGNWTMRDNGKLFHSGGSNCLDISSYNSKLDFGSCSYTGTLAWEFVLSTYGGYILRNEKEKCASASPSITQGSDLTAEECNKHDKRQGVFPDHTAPLSMIEKNRSDKIDHPLFGYLRGVIGHV
eukprot:CAMPEP_0172497352 /NCGR_PEP_ID=MMETSP1066-20121228/98647_1 /TAXON_ID=671091 /ORGANISM="Coscinodiscus wailesii, Strain CCMP2513" /LENGTH=174 /DNA_ID=CAMNT_0013270059 /DNA_START=87 /DNA_END=611 /DNA_ORIENTATION=+